MMTNTVYRAATLALVGIGLGALLAYWLGGWVLGHFLEHTVGIWVDPIRCSLPVGRVRLPFWPVSSLFLMIMHGVFMFRYGVFSASLGVPTRFWNQRCGGYDARLENPFVKVIARDLIVVGILLGTFVCLCSYGGFGG